MKKIGCKILAFRKIMICVNYNAINKYMYNMLNIMQLRDLIFKK
jgi:hypothetical protein